MEDREKLDFHPICPHVRELSAIENVWRPMKQYIRTIFHYDDDITKGIVVKSCDDPKQETIDKWLPVTVNVRVRVREALASH